ncbi:cold-shock protein [Pseudomonas canadensis]|uniref:cold-shock protein n=1 Tax=Pseudomonas canadensis TaxID=915099 RepID=UPI002B243801|nr:cold-shock protein [Pseudomonas canadensis]MEB2647179.1 cold-shock protein [Pseudomonas canadensis]
MVLKAVRGAVKYYDQKSGMGLIALENGEGDVRVDFIGSRGIRLAVGLRVEVKRVHGRDAVYASDVRVIP